VAAHVAAGLLGAILHGQVRSGISISWGRSDAGNATDACCWDWDNITSKRMPCVVLCLPAFSAADDATVETVKAAAEVVIARGEDLSAHQNYLLQLSEPGSN
jgi:hypothetical protein